MRDWEVVRLRFMYQLDSFYISNVSAIYIDVDRPLGYAFESATDREIS
jgi:hypothetical protein